MESSGLTVFEQGNRLIVEAELPGVKPEETEETFLLFFIDRNNYPRLLCGDMNTGLTNLSLVLSSSAP